jgi:O-antigen ligase
MALMLLAPVCLLDAGKIHILLALDITVLGIFAGWLREWTPENSAQRRREGVIHWGLWPHYLAGLGLLLLASVWVGLQLVVLRENHPVGISPAYHSFILTFAGTAADPEWALRSLWNWCTGMLLAVVAARRLSELEIARLMKLGAVIMVGACLVSLFEWLSTRAPGLTSFSLQHIRSINPDPLQSGRLQGTAGHPGWFAQYLVLLWPGLLLWWEGGRAKRNLMIMAALALVLVAMVLTAARAGWLAVLIAGPLAAAFIARRHAGFRKALPMLAGAIAVLLIATVIVGGETLWRRVENILRAQDRANYYVTGLTLLREHPFGIGLGTHYQFYGWLFPPGYRWGQFDFVDSHNLILHTWIENGPFVPLMILAGVIGLAWELRRIWPRLGEQEQRLAGVLALALIGAAIVSIAQYIVYIRIVELLLWTMGGAVIGICRRRQERLGEIINSPKGQRLLLACGVAAVFIASGNSHRVYAGEVPRGRSYDDRGRLAMWTGQRWRVAVESDIERIAFSLYRRDITAHGRITWPDGSIQPFTLKPGPADAPFGRREAVASFEFRRDPRPPQWTDAPGWLTIEVSPLWTPANFDESSSDRRGLGVYIMGLEMESAWRREHFGP